MKIVEIIKEIRINQGVKSKIVVFIFRLSTWYAKKNIFLKLIGLPFFILNKIVNEFLFCVEIPSKTSISFGLKIFHPHSIVINENTLIGKNCTLRQGVTIGNTILKNGKESFSPVIGTNVEFGANSIVLGNVTIGNNAIIGAGAVVTKSISDGKTVVGYGFRELS